MAPETPPRIAVERLVEHLFEPITHDASASDVSGSGGRPLVGDELAGEIAGWLAGSGRFRAFAEVHRDKIRKKLRGARDAGARQDVRAELAIARLLLADRRIVLAFETYGSGRPGPDFTATFRANRTFNLEVTRLRGSPGPAAYAWLLLAKLRQLRPSVPNGLLVAIDGLDAQADDVDAAVRLLRARADAKEESFFADRGFSGTRGFYDRFLRLGALFVWSEAATGDARAAAWLNRSARLPLPAGAVEACLQCLRAGPA